MNLNMKAIRKEYKKTVVKLEKEKLKIKKDLEREVKRFAKLSRQTKLSGSRAPVGRAANDWKLDEEIWRLLAD